MDQTLIQQFDKIIPGFFEKTETYLQHVGNEEELFSLETKLRWIVMSLRKDCFGYTSFSSLILRTVTEFGT